MPTTGPNVRPGEKPPALAAIGHHNGPAGAIIFATYWMQSIDWAYATTDSALSRTLFSSSCTGCTRFLRISIDGVRAAGRHFIGGRIRLLHTVIAPNDHRNGATAVADVTVAQRPLEEVDSTGAVRQRTPASGRVTFRTWLRWLGDRWTVVEWKIADPR